jgi:hypothetical protein
MTWRMAFPPLTPVRCIQVTSPYVRGETNSTGALDVTECVQPPPVEVIEKLGDDEVEVRLDQITDDRNVTGTPQEAQFPVLSRQ